MLLVPFYELPWSVPTSTRQVAKSTVDNPQQFITSVNLEQCVVPEITCTPRKNIGNSSRGVSNANLLKGRHEAKLDRGFKSMEREMGIL